MIHKGFNISIQLESPPVGAQIKLVIDLLFETRKALTPEQINEACHVDISCNKAVFDSLKNNHKVSYDGRFFSYKSKHDLNGKDNLLTLIRKHLEGLPVVDVKDAYPSVMDDLQVLKTGGKSGYCQTWTHKKTLCTQMTRRQSSRSMTI